MIMRIITIAIGMAVIVTAVVGVIHLMLGML